MIDRKTPQEIAVMAQGGKLLGAILAELLEMSVPGASLLAIEKVADRRITEVGAMASFKTVRGYKWATCLCVNDEVVHGIPTDYKLKDGDVLTIDVGLIYKGFHTDTAWTKIIGNGNEEKKKFLAIGQEALWKAIEQAKIGNHIGHISEVIQTIIEGAGYGIVKSLVGHGVGRTLHEEPQVPGLLKGAVADTPLLIGGETIAIEIIYAQGDGAIAYSNSDGWTLATKDRSLTSVFEHTIAVTPNGPVRLT